jgi:hypothetical protein
VSTALSTVVVTSSFGRHCTTHERHAIAKAQEIADRTGTPCGVWARGGWYTVCDVAPELIEPDPELLGWRLWAIADPWSICGH